MYWDENSGTGCQSDGCPSLADESSIGTVPSEAFSILGYGFTTTTTTRYESDYACPRPQTGFKDLRDFDPHAGLSALVTDTAGNVYGALASGGRYGAGLLYEMAQRAHHWFYSTLYSFSGGSNGGSPDSVILGPEGALYGSANGGIQNCAGGSYCGLIFKTAPGARPCASALCSWDETTVYQFTGDTDAAHGTVSAFDSAGNLYGISRGGGAYGQGSVFELTPSQGSWTERVLYSFTGANDGGNPTSLLVGHDGNLYGTTLVGGSGGVVFQLVRSGGGWTENVIYAFTGTTDGYEPNSLIQDSQGSLLGLSVCRTNYMGGCSALRR